MEQQVIDIIFYIGKGQELSERLNEQALLLAKKLLDARIKVAGKEERPYIVHLRTDPSYEYQKLDEFFRGDVDPLRPKEYLAINARNPPCEVGLEVLSQAPNIHVNSNDLDIEKWENPAIIFADGAGAIPDFTKKYVLKRVKLSETEAEKYDMASMYHSMNPSTRGKVPTQQTFVKQHKEIWYKDHVIVLPKGARYYPHPNTLGRAKKIFVTDVGYLKTLVDTCDECGGQLQFLLCSQCGGQMQRVKLCPTCSHPMSRRDGKYNCIDKKCKQKPIDEKGAKKMKEAYACRSSRCDTILTPSEFAASQTEMICTNRDCRATAPHPKVLYTGLNFEHLDISKEYSKIWG